MYLKLTVINRSCCALVWWRQNKRSFPNVAMVAKEYLCIPDTLVPCKRLFSKAGTVITKLRDSLAPHKAEMVIKLMKNLPPPVKKY